MLHVSASPHIRDNATTQRIMLHVIIALLPTVIASGFIFGYRAPLLFVISAAACAGFEALSRIAMKREQTVGDLSSIVTGLLLAASLPVETPIWIVLIGAFMAVVFVKQMFGGLGSNFANPAVTARIILSVSFAGPLSKFSALPRFAATVTPGIAFKQVATSGADLISSATPLGVLNNVTPETQVPSTMDLFLGKHAGCIGEVCILALLIGGIYLLITGIIDIWAPLAYIGSTVAFVAQLGQDPVVHLLSGALVLAAFFMVTDYVTTPATIVGKITFGVGAGILTGLLRIFSAMPEGVSYAILLMNILTPHIERWTAPITLGARKKTRKHQS